MSTSGSEGYCWLGMVEDVLRICLAGVVARVGMVGTDTGVEIVAFEKTQHLRHALSELKKGVERSLNEGEQVFSAIRLLTKSKSVNSY